MIRVRPPLRYIGSKAKYAPSMFARLYTPDLAELREPFYGSGAFTFYGISWLYHYDLPLPRFWGNDLNPWVASFHRELGDPDFLQRLLALRNRFTPEHEKIDDIMAAVPLMRERAKAHDALAYYWCNALCFGQMASDRRKDFSSITRNTVLCRPGLSRRTPDDLLFAHKAMQHIRFTSIDYAEMLLDDTPGVGVFLDPPYWLPNTHDLYGKYSWTMKDHERFVESVQRSRHRLLITYGVEPYSQRQWRSWGFQVQLRWVRVAGIYRADHPLQPELVLFKDSAPIIHADQPHDAWSDIPRNVSIGGVAFAEMNCCDREIIGMLLKSKRKGRCRACNNVVHCKLI